VTDYVRVSAEDRALEPPLCRVGVGETLTAACATKRSFARASRIRALDLACAPAERLYLRDLLSG